MSTLVSTIHTKDDTTSTKLADSHTHGRKISVLTHMIVSAKIWVSRPEQHKIKFV